ncbi:DUF177 domain-containing protein [Aquirufa sp. OSTEICH-129V]|uniref:DUF177 domain-containing protein n=1 Tax=Aquirufa avitistagni TaxID=3104728 RepID=A0ABW6DCS3_9BACT
MKVLEAYQIPIISLEDKAYQYTFSGDDSFFAAFEQDWVEKGTFNVTVDLMKSALMIQVQLQITGSLELTCDRSLERFDSPIAVNEKLIFKYSDHNEDMGDNLFLLDRKEPKLDLSQDIFDFIALEVPMKKLHPKFLAEGADTETDEFIYTTDRADASPSQSAEEATAPRWAALQKLKDLK